jgi:hypothetical protein
MRRLVAIGIVASFIASLVNVKAGAAADPFVVASGDIACAPSVARSDIRCHEDVTAWMLSSNGPHAGAQAVLPLGDLQYPSGKYTHFVYEKSGCQVDADGGTQPCSFHGSYGVAKPPATQWRPTPGNHEYKDPTTPDANCPRLRGTTSAGKPYSACGYERYFGSDTAAPGSSGNGDGNGNYWFKYDGTEAHPILFISLNVGQCEKNGTPCSSTGSVTSFLKQTLASNTINPPEACVVAYWHQPRWSYYGHKNFGRAGGVWQGLFSVTGAKLPDLVLNGHAHNYQRFAPLSKVGEAGTGNPSIREIVVGTGGNDHDFEDADNANPNRPPTPLVHFPQTFGLLRLSWSSSAGTLTAAFHPETTPSTPADTVSFSCN